MNIEKLLKGGQLTEIEVDEVSLVGAPANGRRFLFTKASDFTFEISTDQTFPGTTVKVNGEELKNLDSFRIWLNDVSEEDMEEWGAEPFSASWTLRESSEDGVDQVSTFTVQSTEVRKMDKAEVIKTLKSAFDIDVTEAEFDKLDEEKQDSLTGYAVYSRAMPDQFKKSQTTAITAMIAKDEAPAEKPAEKPAETPKTDAEIVAEAEALDATRDAKIKALEDKFTALEKPAEGEEGEESEPTEVEKSIAKLGENMAVIAKTVGAKLSTETEVVKGAPVGADGWKDNWAVGPE